MRAIIYFIILLIIGSINCLAQKNIRVNYVEIVNNDFPFKMNDYLFVDLENKKSFFLMDFTNQQDIGEISEEIQLQIESSDIFALAGRQESSVFDYLVIDHKNKKTVRYEDFYKTLFKIADCYPELNWTLTNESKKINDLVCKKAIVEYRGRTWEAWYAPSINLPYGPYKLHGLPGLIIEASDIEGRYYYKMAQLSYDVEDFSQTPDDKAYKEVTLKKFLIYEDEFHNLPEDLGSDLSDTSPIFYFLDGSREKEFEFDIEFSWEKNNK